MICFNPRNEFIPTQVEEHRCAVALGIMEKNCNKDNPQPCIVVEDRVQDRCYYLPLSICVPGDDYFDILRNHPDACHGTCEDVANYFDDPDNYPQPICNTDF